MGGYMCVWCIYMYLLVTVFKEARWNVRWLALSLSFVEAEVGSQQALDILLVLSPTVFDLKMFMFTPSFLCWFWKLSLSLHVCSISTLTY